MAEKLTEEQVAEFKKAFSAVDRNGDDTIDTKELGAVFKTLGYHLSEAELKSLIQAVDKDGDGVINFQEFLEAMAKRLEAVGSEPEALREAFRVFDLNNDGRISVAELKQAVTNMGMEISEEEVDEMVREVDTDQDGHVDYEEFVRMLTSK
ncbi:calmodulin-like [Choloepus didactylus]|uniref:calmodulin-like n=1 Tax=Choloepus didactylus TaxID=27675 RepID=UPI00189FAD1E|nr:calmodulin-like [Choloepus didactylus]